MTKLELEIIRLIKEDGGLSDFWMSQSADHLQAVTDLEEKGVIKYLRNQYPFAEYEIVQCSPTTKTKA